MHAAAYYAVATISLAGCEGVVPGIDWQQMIHQHKAIPFGESPYFADGRAMQSPPERTVPRDRVVGRPAFTDGLAGGRYVDRVPGALTRERLAAGRARFETCCAACHGLDGSGDSEVARNMEMRKPPSLVDEPVTSFPPGRVFQVATEGYGFMPSYALELDADERWAAVAWLGVLQRRAVAVDRLPADQRAEAERALAGGGR